VQCTVSPFNILTTGRITQECDVGIRTGTGTGKGTKL